LLRGLLWGWLLWGCYASTSGLRWWRYRYICLRCGYARRAVDRCPAVRTELIFRA
jgi:hypothetical protein